MTNNPNPPTVEPTTEPTVASVAGALLRGASIYVVIFRSPRRPKIIKCVLRDRIASPEDIPISFKRHVVPLLPYLARSRDNDDYWATAYRSKDTTRYQMDDLFKKELERLARGT